MQLNLYTAQQPHPEQHTEGSEEESQLELVRM